MHKVRRAGATGSKASIALFGYAFKQTAGDLIATNLRWAMQDVTLLLRYSSLGQLAPPSAPGPSSLSDPTTPPSMCSMTESSISDHAGLTQEQVAIAGSALAADPNLRQMRFDCVPRFMDEERFWQLYFSAVESIKHEARQSQGQQQHAGSWVAAASADSSANFRAADSFQGVRG